MDLSLILTGALATIGWNLNKKVDTREYQKKRTQVPESEIPEGIYEQGNFKRITKLEKTKLDKFYEDSPFIVGTNTLKVTTNGTDNSRVQPDTVKFADNLEYLPKKQNIYKGPMFNGSKFSTNEKEQSTFKEGFTNNVGLTGEPVTTHSNMTPFFGANVKESRDVGTLSRYSGDKGRKSQQPALMNTLNPKQNVFGTQSTTDAFQARVNEGRYYSIVLPFNQTAEQPIPQEYARPQARNVDELRAANNVRTENEARIAPGSGNYKRAESLGEKTNVFTPRTFETRENYGTTGTGGKLVTNFNAKMTNKAIDTATAYPLRSGADTTGNNIIRATGVDDGSGTYIYESKKQDTLVDGYRNRTTIIPTVDGSRQERIYVPGQERDTQQGVRYGISTDKTFGQRIASTDQARTTIKELTSYSYIPSGNAQAEFKPSSREHLKTFSAKTRADAGYIPSGSTKQVNLVMPNFETKDRAEVINYNGIGSSVVKNGEVFGQQQNKKMETSSHDFSDRIGPVRK